MSSYSPFCIAAQLRESDDPTATSTGAEERTLKREVCPRGTWWHPEDKLFIGLPLPTFLEWHSSHYLHLPFLGLGPKKKNCPIFPQHVCLIQVTTCNTAVNNQNFSSWPSSGGTGCSEDQAQIRGSLSPRCPSPFTRGFQKHWDLQFYIKQKCRHITTFVSLALTERCRHTHPFSGYLLLWQEFLST